VITIAFFYGMVILGGLAFGIVTALLGLFVAGVVNSVSWFVGVIKRILGQ